MHSCSSFLLHCFFLCFFPSVYLVFGCSIWLFYVLNWIDQIPCVFFLRNIARKTPHMVEGGGDDDGDDESTYAFSFSDTLGEEEKRVKTKKRRMEQSGGLGLIGEEDSSDEDEVCVCVGGGYGWYETRQGTSQL